MTESSARPAGPAGYRHPLPIAAGIVLLFVATLGALALHGRRGRVILPAPVTVPVGAPAEALEAWRREGVRGRVLLLFDRYPHFNTDYVDYRRGAPLNDGNFVEYAIFENVVRKVFFVVRDEEWDAVARQPELYHAFRSVPGVPRALYLHTSSGVPLVAAAASSLPRLAEPALVYVNAAVFDPAEAQEMLRARAIASDLVVVLAAKGAP